MNYKTPDTQLWDRHNHKIISTVGKWRGGEDVDIRGKLLLQDLLPTLSYMQLHVFNVTGKSVDIKLAQWLEKSFFLVSYPDARIWCNQIAAFAGLQQASPIAGVVSACLAADSHAYGSSQTQWLAMSTLQDLFRQYGSGESLKTLVAQFPVKHGLPAIMGFARPADKTDERLVPMQKISIALGFVPGEYQKFADQLSEYLHQSYGAQMNIAGYIAAFLLDHDFSPDEVYRLRALAVASGAMACFGEQVQVPKECFLTLKCEDVEYTGPRQRVLV